MEANYGFTTVTVSNAAPGFPISNIETKFTNELMKLYT
jgi:hypothetical protein